MRHSLEYIGIIVNIDYFHVFPNPPEEQQSVVKNKRKTPSKDSKKTKPVAIAILPREGFSFVQRSLEALYAYTDTPFDVTFFEGRADDGTRQYLHTFAGAHKNFRIVYSDHLLGQAQARNLALEHYRSSRYLVLMDNEVIVRKGWLENMLTCAEEEKAALVAPLVLFTLNQRIHSAGGGFLHITERQGKQVIREEILGLEEKPKPEFLVRRKIDYPELHCILIDRKKLPGNHLFDENVETLDIDLGMALLQKKARVFYEPTAVVDLPFPLPLRPIDYDYFRKLWDYETWETKHRNFQKKWNAWPEDNHKKEFFKSQQRLVLFARLFGPNVLTLGVTNTFFLLQKRVGSTLKDLWHR